MVSDALDRIQFTLENRTGGAHETGLGIAGLPNGSYTVSVDGRQVARLDGGSQRTLVALPVGAGATSRVIIASVRR